MSAGRLYGFTTLAYASWQAIPNYDTGFLLLLRRSRLEGFTVIKSNEHFPTGLWNTIAIVYFKQKAANFLGVDVSAHLIETLLYGACRGF
jgi:hypothetical protein